ncbi:hypothetical protein PsAD5_02534 [Pseudovibrio sp. Ad5]|uniref:hypothetical protein n=1 Tax=Pseudovibrio sp. Ad5 TaxID=989436 RepID=UPI0007AEA8D6|nr:hypothetical protein [Pseudovibrio sp. Ad5]KZK96347.1 hypothetical protein PsAD5_02534 [Pseudovibrio sp. Ad5]
MIGLIASFISVGVVTLIAYGALAGAALAFLARFDPRTPDWLSTLVAVSSLCVSVWHFSALHYDQEAEVVQLRADYKALTRLTAAHKIIAEQANASLLERIQQMRELEEKVRDYELELARGTIAACPSDPAYLNWMRSLKFQKTL